MSPTSHHLCWMVEARLDEGQETRVLADRYELGREIGRGGMGSVWLGHDTVLDRDVAIKQIGMAHGGAEPDVERAEREAHLAARINHQNVVAVFDLIDEGGHQWLVMEHVDGPTLAALLADHGPLDDDELVPIIEQVAGALAAAHGHGIVHRDVKPSNILLTSAGVAKLSDFGVARAEADAVLTQTGLVTGSPAYLSPEVASGRSATPASDVWSLGATIFHALTGSPPYEVGDNVLGALYRIVNDDPPRLPRPGRLATLVEAMMQHDPDARPTMAEVVILAQHGSEAPVAPTDTIALPVPPPAPETPPALEAPPAPRGDAHPAIDRRIWALLTVAAAIVVFVVVANNRGDDEPSSDTPAAATSTSATPAPTDDAPSTTPEPDDDVTAAAIEGFVADYLTTASSDPRTGFTMLTPAFQEQSNGFEGYEGFWGKVGDLDLEQISADPEAMKVSYTYSYDYEGERRSDAVTLQLQRTADGFLISGEV
jgi:eukaryotic-like serine/threonine-protein kinase